MAETAARRWLRNRRALPKEVAAALVQDLIWRGISAFPRQGRTPGPESRSHTLGGTKQATGGAAAGEGANDAPAHSPEPGA